MQLYVKLLLKLVVKVEPLPTSQHGLGFNPQQGEGKIKCLKGVDSECVSCTQASYEETATEVAIRQRVAFWSIYGNSKTTHPTRVHFIQLCFSDCAHVIYRQGLTWYRGLWDLIVIESGGVGPDSLEVWLDRVG